MDRACTCTYRVLTDSVSLADIKVFDTCGDPDTAMRDVFFAVKEALEEQDVPLLGEPSGRWPRPTPSCTILFHLKFICFRLGRPR